MEEVLKSDASNFELNHLFFSMNIFEHRRINNQAMKRF